MDTIKLLVVDDEKDFLETLAERLEIRGVDVSAASNGADAVELIEDNEFDVALIDLRMPGMSGEELLKKIKKASPLTEVIVFTGHGSLDSAVECLREGSYHYLQKPCDIDKLLEVLTEAYKKHVQNKLDVNNEKMEELMGVAVGGTAREILDRLRKLDDEG